jgi:diguanylate cyclase (GGDEF)-like protein
VIVGRAASDREAAAEDRRFLRGEMERSHLDELAGAYRRGLRGILLRHEMRRAERQAWGLTLIFIDADDLKQTNARWGHAAGDDLLRQVFDGVQTKLRSYDPIVRWGGDEFVCTISGISTAEAQARIEGTQTGLNEREPPVSVTFGLFDDGTERHSRHPDEPRRQAQREAKQVRRRPDV